MTLPTYKEGTTDSYSNELEQLKSQMKQISAEKDGLEKQLADEKLENVALVDQLQDDK